MATESNMATESKISDLEAIFVKVFESFQCPICMMELSQTSTTKCGHRFCDKCIRECLNSSDKCPLCNQVISQDQLIRDLQFDNLRDDMKVFKEKQMHALISKLVLPNGHNEADNIEFTPLENVMRKHFIKSLQIHQNYVQSLKKSCILELETIDERTRVQIEMLDRTNPFELAVKSEEIQKLAEFEKRRLEGKLNALIELIAKSYDKYLEKNPNLPFVLPVTVDIKFMPKSWQLKDFELKPNDTSLRHNSVGTVLEYLKKCAAQREDAIQEFGDDLLIFCLSPFKKCSFDEARSILNEYKYNGMLQSNVELIDASSDYHLVLENSIKTGSELLVFGSVKFESDLPQECFKKTYASGKAKSMDYFQCKTCDLKWICKSCRNKCHSGPDHQVVEFSMKHKPTWACCYCDRKECLLK